MHWRTAVGVLAPPVVKEVNMGNLLELATAAEVRECVGALQKEH